MSRGDNAEPCPSAVAIVWSDRAITLPCTKELGLGRSGTPGLAADKRDPIWAAISDETPLLPATIGPFPATVGPTQPRPLSRMQVRPGEAADTVSEAEPACSPSHTATPLRPYTIGYSPITIDIAEVTLLLG